MRKPIVWIAIMGIALWSLFPGVVDARSDVTLGVSFDKDVYKRGEPIIISVTMTNTGTHPVWVNTRCYLAAAEVPVDRREVVLEITLPSGEPLQSTYTHVAGFPKSDDFQVLEPGEEFVSNEKRHLEGYFRLTEVGDYTVVAVYQNVYGQEIGLETFKGPVSSEPVSFTISE